MMTMLKRVQKFWKYGSGRMAMAAFFAHSVSISIGICQGYSAILLPQLAHSGNVPLGTEESSWIASLGAVTNPIGSILSGFLAEYLGRKRSIQLTTIPFVLGWLCIGFARDLWWLYAGRLITGVAAGMSSASYTYVSEISTPHLRGVLQALGPICASFGILLTYSLGYIFHWTTVALTSISFAVFTLVTMQLLPESPAHLIKVNAKQAGFDAFLWLRRNNAQAQQEVETLTESLRESEVGASWHQYFSAATIKPFFVLVTLFLLQELSGIYTLLFYAVNFFEETDLNLDNYVSSILVGVIRFSMALLVALLLQKYGRKSLCIISSTGMAFTMCVMVVYFKYYELNPLSTRILPLLPLICVIFNVLFSMLGMLPIPWILVGELFPLPVRSILAGIVICLAQIFIFFCVKIYPNMIECLGFSNTLITFFLASMLAIVFCQWILPETKDKSLQEIEQYFSGKRDIHNENSKTPIDGIFTIKISS